MLHEGVDMSTPTIEELALSERAFLHDISNHILVAQGMTSLVIKVIKENSAVDSKEVDRLERALDAINKMTAALKQRRAVLHSV